MKKFNDVQADKLIDTTLTPENAEEMGYVYVDDVFNPYDSLREVLELAEKKGYKFGTPEEKLVPRLYFGLYRPMKDK